ncbi:glycosyltransferase [Flavobacterium sp.]|uniref:glycosyltransferase n=1 Tax=Flavobacterium sp. TaxID=239 RepID=UPI00326510CC
MKFAIITHVNHKYYNKLYFGYDPYIREMNIWLQFVDEVIIVAPAEGNCTSGIDSFYQHSNINFRKVPNFSFITAKESILALFKFPIIIWNLFSAMKSADHIHLRCPGNIGLLACFVQILFPHKIKTAKYAGNWDPNAKQPWTYKLQKYILKNTFLTRNMQVLVYGNWNNQSKNIKPFFTASYSESEKEIVAKTSIDSVVGFIFVGSLVTGKNPMYAIKLVHNLIKEGNKATLNIYGEGSERLSLEDYIQINQLGDYIILNGNQSKETLKKAYQESHFVILPSKSEGWPKAIAEGMFWGCVPLSTSISCIPFMLDFGNRGLLLKMNLKTDGSQIVALFKNKSDFDNKSQIASNWSRSYTTDIFEAEIKKLLTK